MYTHRRSTKREKHKVFKICTSPFSRIHDCVRPKIPRSSTIDKSTTVFSQIYVFSFNSITKKNLCSTPLTNKISRVICHKLDKRRAQAFRVRICRIGFSSVEFLFILLLSVAYEITQYGFIQLVNVTRLENRQCIVH